MPSASAGASKSRRGREKPRSAARAAGGQARESAAVREGLARWQYALLFVPAVYLAFEIYAPALAGHFVFDDLVLPQVALRNSNRPFKEWVSVRPVLMSTYWVNFRLFGLATTSYHVVNLLLHIANAAFVFLICRKLLASGGKLTRRLELFAAGAGALFLLHPAQSEAVAYVAGRSETLSAFFFLAAFTVFLYRRRAAISWTACAVVLLLFAGAVGSKEHAIVLPALLLLTDYYWNPGFSTRGIRENWRLYLGSLFASGLGLAGVWSYLSATPMIGSQVAGFSWLEYFFTQWRAVLGYIRLFLFPAGLNADHDFAISRGPLEHGALAALVAILLLAAAAIRFRRRYPLASYGWLAFLLVLAPTSSVIPIADVFTERRLYLPMMGLLLVVLEFARRIEAPGRAWAAALALVCVPLAYATRERSKVWADRIRFWEDTVSKSPRKWRPRYNLAVVYQEAGQCRKAVQQYEAGAQAQKPDYDYIMMWGLAHRCAGEAGPALARFREAAALEKSAGVYELIASLEAAQGRSAEALASLAQAEAIDRTYWRTYLTRGNVYSSLKNYEAARTAFREVLRVYPSHREAARGLALAEERLRTEAGTRSAR